MVFKANASGSDRSCPRLTQWVCQSSDPGSSSTPVLTGQSEESGERPGHDEPPSQGKSLLGSEQWREMENVGAWRGLQAPSPAAADPFRVLCSSTANTTVFNASALLTPNTNTSLVSVLSSYSDIQGLLFVGRVREIGKQAILWQARLAKVSPSCTSGSPVELCKCILLL